MSEQYFTKQPNSNHQEKKIQLSYGDQQFSFITDSGVFSKDRMDYGSLVLMNALVDDLELESGHSMLELGSGYGPLSIVFAKCFPSITVTGIEVNERAINLARRNAEINDLDNINWHLADVTQLEFTDTYDVVITNPPIRAGKKVIQAFVDKAYTCLNKKGNLYLVIQKKQGAPSMKSYMETLFGNVERIALDKGYWVLKSKK